MLCGFCELDGFFLRKGEFFFVIGRMLGDGMLVGMVFFVVLGVGLVELVLVIVDELCCLFWFLKNVGVVKLVWYLSEIKR